MHCVTTHLSYLGVLTFAIDEMRVKASSRRDPYTTFNKMKPIRKGRNIYAACCASRFHHGLLHSVVSYCGEHTYKNDMKLDDDEGKMDNIVHQLMEKCVGDGNEIFVMDKGFTSVYNQTTLARYFGRDDSANSRVGMVGVVNKNRACLPKEFFSSEEWKEEEKEMEKGDFVQLWCDELDLHLTIWKDTKLLILMDNCINPFIGEFVERRSGREVEEFEVPFVCKFYNTYMGEVDAASGHRKTFPIDLKHRRNNNRSFWGLCEWFALVNPAAICIADIYGDRKVLHKSYRDLLVSKWIRRYVDYKEENDLNNRKPRPKTQIGIVKSTLAKCRDAIGNRVSHQLVHYDPNNPKKQVHCFVSQCQLKTTWICSCCVPTTGFCHPITTGRDCFHSFHDNAFPTHNIL